MATNAGGPHTFKYGVTGDWVTGIEAVIPPGETIAVGGAQRKDVGGYDLRSLLVGSEGTLGIITAVRLRLMPAPEEARALIAFHATPAEGCSAILDVLAAGIVPAALDFLDGETLRVAGGAPPPTAGFALLAEVDGTHAQARAAHAELAAVLACSALAVRSPEPGALWEWRERIAGAVTAIRGGKVSEDIVVPVERLAEALARFEEIAARHGLRSCAWGHGADGNVHANLLIDPRSEAERAAAAGAAEELFTLAGELGGAISGEHGVGWLKRGRLARQWPAGALRMHEEIKRAFDPKGLLNPGKKLARLPAAAPPPWGG